MKGTYLGEFEELVMLVVAALYPVLSCTENNITK